MPEFCDVALPVPLDTAFTYSVPDGLQPVVGGRVLVPFRQQRMSGIVTGLHDRKPKVVTKNVISVLDSAPVLDEPLIRLGQWIADYYLAPVGEVFRTMLPLGAEFKRAIAYRITEEGQTGATPCRDVGIVGAFPEDARGPVGRVPRARVSGGTRSHSRRKLAGATRASKALLAGMVRKKWIAREDLSDARDAARTVKFAVLKAVEGKLNANQQTLVDTLAATGGKAPVEALQSLEIPRTTLGTLVKRGLVEIVEEAAEFTVSG